MNDYDLGIERIEIRDGDAGGLHIFSRCRSCKQWFSERTIRYHICEQCAPTIQEAIDLADALDSLKKL